MANTEPGNARPLVEELAERVSANRGAHVFLDGEVALRARREFASRMSPHAPSADGLYLLDGGRRFYRGRLMAIRVRYERRVERFVAIVKDHNGESPHWVDGHDEFEDCRWAYVGP